MLRYKKLFTLLALCSIATTNLFGIISELRRYKIDINGQLKEVCFIAIQHSDDTNESLEFMTEVMSNERCHGIKTIPILLETTAYKMTAVRMNGPHFRQVRKLTEYLITQMFSDQECHVPPFRLIFADNRTSPYNMLGYWAERADSPSFVLPYSETSPITQHSMYTPTTETLRNIYDMTNNIIKDFFIALDISNTINKVTKENLRTSFLDFCAVKHRFMKVLQEWQAPTRPWEEIRAILITGIQAALPNIGFITHLMTELAKEDVEKVIVVAGSGHLTEGVAHMFAGLGAVMVGTPKVTDGRISLARKLRDRNSTESNILVRNKNLRDRLMTIPPAEITKYMRNFLRICPGCGENATKQCARCQNMFYCSKYCQRQEWRSHKKHCHAPPQQGMGSRQGIS